MNIFLFCHSIVSDWNHGNAHFLRGIVTELIKRGENVKVYEPENGWSYSNMLKDGGNKFLESFKRYYPLLGTNFYDLTTFSPERELAEADIVIVHEWNDPELINKLGEYRKKSSSFTLFFLDTHHRSVTDINTFSKYELTNYDGALVFGNIIAEVYRKNEWVKRVWVWHEAADTNVFFPRSGRVIGDLVWIGNWGDEERTQEIYDYLIKPVNKLGLKCRVYGVRYPDSAINDLKKNGIEYCGWLPNFKVPGVFAEHKLTIHIPRRPYIEMIPGIPTIRPFEAMACKIPLISRTWNDSEKLFNKGKDFLMVDNPVDMTEAMNEMIHNENLREKISQSGLQTIRRKHTCSHRVDQFYDICEELGLFFSKAN